MAQTCATALAVLGTKVYKMDNDNQVTFYSNATLKRFSLIDAYAELKRQKEFSVFLCFVDPRTNRYVQDSFKFYPNAVNTFSIGFCYLADHNGLCLEIPSCMKWWASSSGPFFIKRKCNILKEGTYQPVTFELEIGTAIRVPMQFTTE